MEVRIEKADLEQEDHCDAVRALTAAYGLDPMGNHGPLPEEILDRLIPGLRAHPTTEILLAYVDGQPVGIATCFRGFSSFAAAPLLNLHDLAVLPAYRGAGVGRRLLDAVADHARSLGCCKVTLEVQENNARARGVYAAAGFKQAAYASEAGGALFYAKPL